MGLSDVRFLWFRRVRQSPHPVKGHHTEGHHTEAPYCKGSAKGSTDEGQRRVVGDRGPTIFSRHKIAGESQ